MTELTTDQITTDQITTETVLGVPSLGKCPAWCVSPAGGAASHTHVGVVASVQTPDRPFDLRLEQAGEAEPRLVVGGQELTLEQATFLAQSVQRLVDQATLAEAGLDFVGRLAAGAGISVGEMALASGVELTRLVRQQAGARVLTVHEVDRLAMVVAQMSAARARGQVAAAHATFEE